MKYTHYKGKILSTDIMIAYINIFKPKIRSMAPPNIDLDFKGWSDDNGNNYSPNDVLANPKKYKADYERIMKADFNYPIITIDESFLADGIHRVVKAIISKRKSVKYVDFTQSAARAFIVSEEVYDRNNCHELIEIFFRRFVKRN